MKLLILTKKGCPWCKKYKEQLKGFDSCEIVIRNANDSDKSKYNLTMYPTTVVLSNKNKVLNTLSGFRELNMLNAELETSKKLEKMLG